MFTKITNAELNSRGATTLANQPTISPQALKEEFDAPAKNIIAPHFNALIDELGDSAAASSIGAVKDGQSTTIQSVLESIGSDIAEIEQKIPEDAEDIQDAVNKRHTHSNKSVIDKFSEVGGNPYYNGNPIAGSVTVDSELSTTSENPVQNKVITGALNNIGGTPEQIADAVSKKHSHSNISVLDKFSESQDGDPLYNGEPIGGGGGGGGGINYTTTEQNTGLTWIDSKPVYQKTIKQEFDPSTQVNSFYIDNIETVIDFEAIIESIKTSDPNNDRFYYPIPWYSSSSYYATIHSSVTATTPTRTEFRLIQAGFKPSSTSPARTLSLILTVRYTKRS